MNELELSIPISKYPSGYIPSGDKFIIDIDSANGNSDTYIRNLYIEFQ